MVPISNRDPGDECDPFAHLPASERCSVCGQPDNCGDCDHTPLSRDQVCDLAAIEWLDRS
jgi:hypothetical protein